MIDSYDQHPEWRDFSSPEDQNLIEETVHEKWIPSGAHHIHLDIYRHNKPAPTIIYCHGMATCGRIMAHFALRLFKAGFNVICPDLVGFGLTTAKHGSGTIPVFIQNLNDTINFAKKEFSGARFLTGISLGGILSYYTACAGADVKAIASYCLLDLSARNTHGVAQTGKGFINSLIKIVKVAHIIAPNTYIPSFRKFLSFDTLSADAKVNQVFKSNALCIKKYTFGFAYSLVSTAPLIPFENFKRLPVLVIHGDHDRMIPEKLSRASFERLSLPKKYVCLKGCEHVPIDPQHVRQYIESLVEWFRAYL